MTYKAIFTGWENLTIEDLLVAYRKAKVDCFYEDTFPTAVKFAEYEQNLLENLEHLLSSLKKNEGFLKDQSLIGEYRVVPKKISLSKKEKTDSYGHVHFSDPQKILIKIFEENEVCASFRIIGDFPVETHIISALWINMIGEKFDENLTDSCYGARLKRVESNEKFLLSKKVFHITAIGSFQPYFQPYQKWRSDGLNAIRSELEKDKSVIAVSLDLKSYYHYIDPQVISSKDLHSSCGITLSDSEFLFTKQLADFLENWSKGSINFSKNISVECEGISGGLVIGLTVSRIISNMILNNWDNLINEKVSPVHYGRYIDDMFLVIRDTGKIKNSKELMEVLRERIAGDVLKNDEDNRTIWEINQKFSEQDKTRIRLQSDKQKLFILKGRVGLDLLDSIEKDIHDLSSEHRLMPSPDQLDKSTAAKVLSAAGGVGQSADTLRRADGLTLRRLSWALQLRHVETFANDLPPNVWKEQRNEFYQFAHNHILRADSIFEHFKYLPRLLGFAINLNEWEQAKKILLKSYEALDLLKEQVQISSSGEINGAECQLNENIWKHLRYSLTISFVNAATRYLNFRNFSPYDDSYQAKISKIFFDDLLETIDPTKELLTTDFSITNFYKKASLVAHSDLAKIPYKEILKLKSIDKLFSNSLDEKNQQIKNKFKNLDLIQFNSLERFLNSTCKKRLKNIHVDKQKYESYFPYLFPTRPYTATEISELAPECVGLPNNECKICEDKSALIWAKYTQAIRGVWIKPTLLAIESDCVGSIKTEPTETTFLHLGNEKRDKVIVALTNLRTDEKDWGCTASDKPNLTLDRYQRISDLVNDVLKLKPKPDYVIFPELSIPLEWLDSITSRFCSLGISLIAGTEYRHFEKNKLISEAVLVLSDNRLGYPSFVKIWQPKLEPAVKEDHVLMSIHGKEWNFDITKFHLRKPIYVHHGFHFGIMVCSELQNSKARISFQGKVDALTILSWNQDLDTFSSLIESTALDIHAYTILVNNRMYGDSRVRSPAKHSFNRDIARVRGGENDFAIAATLDIKELRVFQSRMKRWPQDGDKFKPVPEGFKITQSRRKLPPI